MEKQSFVIMLRPAPNYGVPETEDLISKHFAYLQKLLAEGTLVIAGRFTEVLLGLVMINTQDKETAESIMKADPAVTAGIFHAELYQWSIALQAC